MNSRMAVLCMICALLASACSAAHSAPPPAADCTSLVMMMADCLAFVSEGSTTAKPEGQCCSGLKTVLKTDAECLCEAFKNAGQLGVKLNTTKALTLPAACHVSAPSVSNCVPGAPVAVSPSSVAGAPNSVIGANDVSPAPAPAPGKSSAASSPLAPVILLVAAVVAASYALF